MLTAELKLWRFRLQRWQWAVLILLGLAVAYLPAVLIVGGIGALPIGLTIVAQPLIGLGLSFILGPVWGWENVFIGGPIAILSSGRIVLFLTIGSWMLRNLVRGRVPIATNFLNGPILIYVLMNMVTLWGARSLFDGIKEVIKYIEILFIIWMLLDLTRQWPRRRVINGLIMTLLAVGCVQAVWGINQFIVRGTGPGHFIISGRLFRATGSFMQPNPYGGYMALLLSLAVGTLAGVVFHQVRKLPPGDPTTTAFDRLKQLLRNAPHIPILFVVCGLLAFALLGSWSRGAWFNFMSALAVFAYVLPRSRERGLLLLIVSGAIVVLAWTIGLIPPAFQNRLLGFLTTFTTIDVYEIALTPTNFAVVERLAHWQAAINMMAESIWFGVGIGNYAAAYPEYMVPGWEEPLGHAHNIYLNVLAESGIWGLIAYGVLWVPVFRKVLLLSRKLDWPLRGTAIGLLAGWVGFSVHHLLDNLYVNNNTFVLAVMFTLLIMLESELREPTGEESFTWGDAVTEIRGQLQARGFGEN